MYPIFEDLCVYLWSDLGFWSSTLLQSREVFLCRFWTFSHKVLCFLDLRKIERERERSSPHMVMKEEEVRRCEIQAWYPAFRRHSLRTLILPLPEEFISFLMRDDGLYLPKDSLAIPTRTQVPYPTHTLVLCLYLLLFVFWLAL